MMETKIVGQTKATAITKEGRVKIAFLTRIEALHRVLAGRRATGQEEAGRLFRRVLHVRAAEGRGSIRHSREASVLAYQAGRVLPLVREWGVRELARLLLALFLRASR